MPARISFGICDSRRFILRDSSLFSPFGVYSDYLFVWNYIFPRWGLTIIFLSWGTTCTFLFYARAINSTMLTSVVSIATHLSTSQWDNINNSINHFLEYAATHPDAKLTYKKSDMHLWVHIDTSYVNEPKESSQDRGYHCFRKKPNLPYNMKTYQQNITTLYLY